jgi:hypothetical protein
MSVHRWCTDIGEEISQGDEAEADRQETTMTANFKKTLTVSLAALTMTAAVASATPAAAGYGRHGAFAAGLLGGLAVGAIAAGGVSPYYSAGPYYGYGDCWIDSRPVYNRWGDFVGYRRVRVCN